MAERQAALVQVLLEHEPVDARLAAAGEIELVHLEDAVEGAHVQDEFPGAGRQRAAHSAAASHRSHRHTAGAGPAQDRGHLLAPRRPSDQHLGWCIARALLHDPRRPHVADRPLVQGGGAHDLFEFSPHFYLAAKRPASQPVRIGTPNPHGPP